MRHGPLGRKIMAAAAALAVATSLAACGGDDTEATDAGGTAAGGDEVTDLDVGYFPLVHTASVVHAAETGIFEDAGLNVELAQTAGGAQAIPSLMAGEYDITYGNYTSALLAAQQGLPVVIIAGNDVGADDHGIMVNPDSELQSPADLAGKRVAVNNLQNIGTVAVKAVVEDAGVDPASVELVELPLPEMQAALERGDVDAIWQVEPFKARSLAAGSRELFPLFTGPVEDMPVAGWLTTREFLEENPEAVASFQEALATSVEQLEGNRERLVELVPTYTQVPPEVVEQVALPAWDTNVDVEQLEEMEDYMLSFDIINEPFDVSTIIAEGAS